MRIFVLGNELARPQRGSLRCRSRRRWSSGPTATALPGPAASQQLRGDARPARRRRCGARPATKRRSPGCAGWRTRSARGDRAAQPRADVPRSRPPRSGARPVPARARTLRGDRRRRSPAGGAPAGRPRRRRPRARASPRGDAELPARAGPPRGGARAGAPLLDALCRPRHAHARAGRADEAAKFYARAVQIARAGGHPRQFFAAALAGLADVSPRRTRQSRLSSSTSGRGRSTRSSAPMTRRRLARRCGPASWRSSAERARGGEPKWFERVLAKPGRGLAAAPRPRRGSARRGAGGARRGGERTRSADGGTAGPPQASTRPKPLRAKRASWRTSLAPAVERRPTRAGARSPEVSAGDVEAHGPGGQGPRFAARFARAGRGPAEHRSLSQCCRSSGSAGMGVARGLRQRPRSQGGDQLALLDSEGPCDDGGAAARGAGAGQTSSTRTWCACTRWATTAARSTW